MTRTHTTVRSDLPKQIREKWQGHISLCFGMSNFYGPCNHHCSLIWGSNNLCIAATTIVLCLNHYFTIVMSMKKTIISRVSQLLFKTFVWFCLVFQIFTTIATRNHYTVDIWLAALFSYMNWTWHCHVIIPRDPVVKKAELPNSGKIY